MRVLAPFFYIMKQNSWLIEENEMETKFKLVVKNSGSYTADSFLELIWIVFKHRCQHLLKGDGFID
mgnify:CR=1 FL=1|jgi:hypothetical protein